MIEEITAAEFPYIRPGGGKALSAESVAVQGLEIDTGFKVPCRWKHIEGRCSGWSLVSMAAKRYGAKVHSTCRDGTLYVLRYA
jgi:hypothetical protein